MTLSKSQYIWTILILGFFGALFIVKEAQDRDPEYQKKRHRELVDIIPIEKPSIVVPKKREIIDSIFCQSTESTIKNTALILSLIQEIESDLQTKAIGYKDESYQLKKRSIDSLTQVVLKDLTKNSLTKRLIRELEVVNFLYGAPKEYIASCKSSISQLEKILKNCHEQ